MDFSWMHWTLPTALFFVAIFFMLVGMTVWQVKAPQPARKGFLPLVTTPGDRFFIGLISSAYIHLVWIGLIGLSVWIPFIACLIWLGVVLRWG